MPAVRLLTVCGSLQPRSSNRAALDVVTEVAGAAGAIVDDAELAGLAPLQLDRDGEPDVPLETWRRQVSAADALVVASPEYAGGLAGLVKNAFDWLVGTAEMYRRTVAVITAGTSGGTHARQQLVQTLTWQGARVVAEVGIGAPRTKSDADGRFTDRATVDALAQLTHVVLGAATRPAEALALARTVVTRVGIDPARVADG